MQDPNKTFYGKEERKFALKNTKYICYKCKNNRRYYHYFFLLNNIDQNS